ncbi:caspase domain-containing protein [Clostridium sp.]|uniref:caspase domain-containing protein n=1 Tax=Clostridium sp. TaxID=1506 RepID=UPI003464C276
MSNIKALVVGVSNYSAMRGSDLPFCINDIGAVTEALVNGLKVNESEILVCGQNGTVTKDSFLLSLQKLISISNENDTIILYFSGHGGSDSSNHYLILSDGIISTQDIIGYLDKISVKNKIFILDSCESGNFSINQIAKLDINSTIEEFVGRGYAVLASSGANEYSYPHPDLEISLYTKFLCEALKDFHIIKEGKKSLYDINRLIFLYLEIWNKRNPGIQQHPIYRGALGGTIFFEVEDYSPFYVKNTYEETEKYIIYKVEPLHNRIAKRYSVKVILKDPYCLKEMATLFKEIIEKVKKLEVYSSSSFQNYWQGKDANIIFGYFGFDEEDMINSNFLCHTTWVDESQNKEWWYRLDKNSMIINGIHFNIHPYYESLKDFTQKNTGEKEELINETRKIMKELISLTEKVIGIYNEFLNGCKTEEKIVEEMKLVILDIEKQYFKQMELNIAPKELRDWSQCCSGLAATIHDFTLYYNEIYLHSRTPENRIACMNMTIKAYYNELEKLKTKELEIQLID